VGNPDYPEGTTFEKVDESYPEEPMSRVKVRSCNVCPALRSDGPLVRCGLVGAAVRPEDVARSNRDGAPPPVRCRLRHGPILMELAEPVKVHRLCHTCEKAGI
jgi:hypothetical protein